MAPDQAPKTRPTPPRPEQTPSVSSRKLLIAGGAVGGLVLVLCVVPISCIGLSFVFRADTNTAKGPTQPEPKSEPIEPPIVKVDKKPKPVEMSPPVKAAVDRGVAFLRRRVQARTAGYSESGTAWPSDANDGALALVGLALLEAKVPPQDPDVQAVLTRVRASGPTQQMVYSIGAMLFFMNR